MRYFALIALLAVVTGCDRPQPVARGPVEVPPAAPQTSAASEDLIGQKAAAVAKGDKPLAKALDKAEGDQQKAELVGSVRPLALLGILAMALAAFMAAEGASKVAMGIAASGLVMMFGPVVYGPIVAHSGAIAWAFILAVVAVLCFHIKISGKKLKANAQALEHVVAGGSALTHPLQHVRDVIGSAWSKAKSEADAIAARLRHFGHMTEAQTVSEVKAATVTMQPPA